MNKLILQSDKKTYVYDSTFKINMSDEEEFVDDNTETCGTMNAVDKFLDERMKRRID